MPRSPTGAGCRVPGQQVSLAAAKPAPRAEGAGLAIGYGVLSQTFAGSKFCHTVMNTALCT
jgi:hypothetical protein